MREKVNGFVGVMAVSYTHLALFERIIALLKKLGHSESLPYISEMTAHNPKQTYKGFRTLYVGIVHTDKAFELVLIDVYKRQTGTRMARSRSGMS